MIIIIILLIIIIVIIIINKNDDINIINKNSTNMRLSMMQRYMLIDEGVSDLYR